MENLPVNPIDILVAVVIVISALLAFSRGAVREVLGIGAWVGAGIATYFGFGFVRPYARDLIPGSDAIADAATGLVIFIVVLIVLTIVNQLIAGRIQRSGLGALDRTLGFIFGILRGAVLVCLAYMLFVWAVEKDDRPPWVDEARTMPYIKQGAATIQQVVPKELAEKTGEKAEQTLDSARKLHDAERSVRELTEPVPTERAPPEEDGYSDRERRQLEGLTDSVDQ